MSELGIKIYKVGGCIRDRLLGLIPKDNDYVVVGATPKYMLDHGFIQVGRNFPVFIHPETKEEYALARTEKKLAAGYHGFSCDASPAVTLIEDLARRDITINAIAEDMAGNLIDPYNGVVDLNNRIIRHVSTAFSEDPLRVIRVARFRALLGFTIAPETVFLMKQITSSGELAYLSQERIFNEIKKVLINPQNVDGQLGIVLFLQTLHQVGALTQISLLLNQVITKGWFTDKLQLAFSRLDTRVKAKFDNQADTLAKIRFAVIAGIISLYQNVEYALAINQLVGDEKSYSGLSNFVSNNVRYLVDVPKASSVDILSLINRLDVLRHPKRFDMLHLVVFSIIDNIDSVFKFINSVVIEFKQIDYESLKQGISHSLFMQKLTEIQLLIIDKLHKQYFGVDKC